jgi:hypothetical protein
MDANKVVDGAELWRFLTFPFAYVSLANAFLGFCAFFFFAPNLRRQLNKGIFGLSVFLVTFLTGLILFMLNFNSPNTPVTGIESLSAYIITLYVFVNRKKDFRYFKAVRLSRLAFPLTLLAAWAMLYLFEHGASQLNNHLIDQSPALLGIGIITGFIGYFLLKNEKSDLISVLESPNYGMNELHTLEPAPILFEKYKSQELKPTSNTESHIRYSFDDPESNEEILNDILEHINESGYESLNDEEKTFLKLYAKSL